MSSPDLFVSGSRRNLHQPFHFANPCILGRLCTSLFGVHALAAVFRWLLLLASMGSAQVWAFEWPASLAPALTEVRSVSEHGRFSGIGIWRFTNGEVRWQTERPTEAQPHRAIELPHLWRDEIDPGQGDTAWYRFEIDMGMLPPALPMAVLLPKISLNADVWINGRLVGQHGRMQAPVTRHRTKPLLFAVEPSLWRNGVNQIQVRIISESGYTGQIHDLLLGPVPEMTDWRDALEFWGNTVTIYCAIYNISLGLLTLAVWFRQDGQQRYGFFGAACVLLGAAAIAFRSVDPWWPPVAWQRMTSTLFTLGFGALSLFGLSLVRSLAREQSALAPRLQETTNRRTTGWSFIDVGVVIGALFISALCLLAPESKYLKSYFAYLLLLSLLGTSVSVLIVRTLIRLKMPEVRLFVPALLFTFALGIHDWLEGMNLLGSHRFVAFPIAMSVLLSAVAWLIAGEFRRAQHALDHLNANQRELLLERERELSLALKRASEERARLAAARERTRILAEMHDEVGVHLSSAIHQIESGRYDSEVLAHRVRSSLDRLKLSIDSMNFEHGDVTALLASLRYRLQPRLSALGLELQWHADILPEWPAGDQPTLRRLQFALFDAIAALLSRPHGGTLSIATRATPDSIVLRIESPREARVDTEASIIATSATTADAPDYPGLPQMLLAQLPSDVVRTRWLGPNQRGFEIILDLNLSG